MRRGNTPSLPYPVVERPTWRCGLDRRIGAATGCDRPGIRTQRSAQRNRSIVSASPRVPAASTTTGKGSEDSSLSGGPRSGHCRTCHRALYIPVSAVYVLC
jgi:hypothetical protein